MGAEMAAASELASNDPECTGDNRQGKHPQLAASTSLHNGPFSRRGRV